jgi:hypothetical protein
MTMTDGPIDLLLASLDVLAAEHPDAHAAMTARLAGLTIAITIDDRSTTLTYPPLGGHRVELATTSRAIAALLGGTESILDAVLADRVFVRAAPEHLERVHDAMSLYLRGAVRCPSFPELLDRFHAALSIRRTA